MRIVLSVPISIDGDAKGRRNVTSRQAVTHRAETGVLKFE